MPRREPRGYTLLELVIAFAVAVVLAAIAIPGYLKYRERAAEKNVAIALADIAEAIEMSAAFDRTLPLSLADALGETPVDPWGNAYRYLPFDAGIPGWMGQRRKDKNLVPINSKFDLYSSGPDGDSRPPLTARQSLDDIIYANDGAFIGRASDY
jgi:general secretion pathway protein G